MVELSTVIFSTCKSSLHFIMSLLQWSSHAHPVTERPPSEACKSVNRCQGTESLQCQENRPIACLACSLVPRPIHMAWEWAWSCLLYPVSLIAFTTCYEYSEMGGSRLAYITCLQAPPLKTEVNCRYSYRYPSWDTLRLQGAMFLKTLHSHISWRVVLWICW